MCRSITWAGAYLILGASVLMFSVSGVAVELERPPAVPLVACDPYFSIWSASDTLTGTDTTHWTGKSHRLSGLVRIDGDCYRITGADPHSVPAMPQTDLKVLPTRTIYTFGLDKVTLELTFTTPVLPEDLDLLSRPVTYVTCTVHSADGERHAVELYFDASAELAVNTPDQEVEIVRVFHDNYTALRTGTVKQDVLGKAGDDIRIDWGYLYLAMPNQSGGITHIGQRETLQKSFATQGLDSLPLQDFAPMRTAAESSVGAVSMDLGNVEDDQPVTRWLVLAYDDLYSIQYMKHNLRPYWRRHGWEADDLLTASVEEYEDLRVRCEAFDKELMNDLVQAGGENYADLCALAYRQCFAAGKFVADANGQPLQFSKENHSNGCIATSDVFYPMAPQFLFFGPTLAKSFVVPFMNYAASENWRFPFAPHDLGTYPHANGQRYGGGETSEENQMPVEECGNLLLLFGAIAKMEGNADFAGLYWPQLEQWGEYLKSKGFDPENQLCTDDFAGHLAHNVNLSAKAICALGAFSQLCALRGEVDRADEYKTLARTFAERWIDEADDGNHFRLAFDRPGTWSQKYNLVWDRILGLNLFPAEVAQKEMTYYREVQNRYGLPLDNREDYTKLDWILWTATLTQNPEDFSALVDPVITFLNETSSRVPMTDWYFTTNGRRRGFTARPVVGGVFLQMLYDDEVWTKYAKRDITHAAGWAPMPLPPRVETLVPTSQKEPYEWRYTTEGPGGNWFSPDFDDSTWRLGNAGFGTRNTPGTVVRTVWNTEHIWLRRTFELKELPADRVALRMHHDEDAEIYLNGVKVLDVSGYTTGYETFEIDPQSLVIGQNTIAIYCHQTSGGQYIDAGLDLIIPRDAQ